MSLPQRPRMQPIGSGAMPSRPKPTMPVRPVLSTYTKTVKKDGEHVEVEASWIITESDARIISHLSENGVATRRILAYLCGATDATVNMKIETLRKRLKTLVTVGVLSAENEQGGLTLYTLTNEGRKFHQGDFIAPEHVPAYDTSTLLNLSAIVARLTVPSSANLLMPTVNGVTVGLPVITRARMNSDVARMMQNGSQSRIQQQQRLDLEQFKIEAGYPTVNGNWSFDQLTANQAEQIRAFNSKGFSEKSTGEWVLPSYFYENLTASGQVNPLVDFVIPFPHVMHLGKPYLNAWAGFVDIDQHDASFYAKRFRDLEASPVLFQKILCFIPDTQYGLAKTIQETFTRMVHRGELRVYKQDDLIVVPYTPLNAPSNVNRLSEPDIPGRATKTFGRG